MTPTDISEQGLESIIVALLIFPLLNRVGI